MHLWRKRLSADRAERWIEGLQAAVDPGRIVVVSTPTAHDSVRLEVYCDGQREADELVERFGGRASEVHEHLWHPAPTTAPGRPLNIGGRLLVTNRPEELASTRMGHPAASLLCIPAAMAFGTGEHATTAMCLRLLMEVARQHQPGKWEMLDLGTGSGILALAGHCFGANRALGVDNDPHAVRTARENGRLNGISHRAVRFVQGDVTKGWLGRQTWPVVAANLFSELLIRSLSAVIAPAVASGGDLILSGVLASQADEVVAAVRTAGLTLHATKRRGRWRAFHCRRS